MSKNGICEMIWNYLHVFACYIRFSRVLLRASAVTWYHRMLITSLNGLYSDRVEWSTSVVNVAPGGRRGREKIEDSLSNVLSTFVTPRPPRLIRREYVASRMAKDADLNFNGVIIRPFSACSGSRLLSFDICYCIVSKQLIISIDVSFVFWSYSTFDSEK